MGSPNSKIDSKNLSKSDENSKISLKSFIKTSSESPSTKFRKLGKLGKGSFASVFKCLNKQTQTICALKCIKKSLVSPTMSDSSYKTKEAAIMRKLDHPNIIKCYEMLENSKYLMISEELNENGTLKDYFLVQSVNPSLLALITKQLLSALAYIHNKGIVHRDIKPENVFITKDRQVKLGDFGCADVLNQEKTLKGQAGTLTYMAPEIFNGSYDEKVDIWSLGVLLLFAVIGKPIILGNNKNEVIENIPLIHEYCQESNKVFMFSNGFLDFIQGLITVDPKYRLSALEALNHPWLKKFGKFDEKVHSDISFKMKNLVTKNTLEKTLSIYINSFYLQNESLELYKYFNAIDTDGDGMINRKEMQEELKIHFNENQAKNISNEFFDCYDMNKNGVIDYSEFITALSSKELVFNKRNVENLFKLIDKNRKGFITVDDLQNFTGVNHRFLFPDFKDFWKTEKKITLVEFKQLLL
jgi:calcium-dependent protein kinase